MVALTLTLTVLVDFVKAVANIAQAIVKPTVIGLLELANLNIILHSILLAVDQALKVIKHIAAVALLAVAASVDLG